MVYLAPIDFEDAKRKTMIRDGTICFSSRFGRWGVLSDTGFFADYDPPVEVGDRYEGGIVVSVTIARGKFWKIVTVNEFVRGEVVEIKGVK